jgi:hypothetical protein
MIDLLDIRLSSGIPLRVIYVPTGSPGPVSGTDSLAREPAVEFYDRRDHTAGHGQQIGGRYAVRGLLRHVTPGEGWQLRHPPTDACQIIDSTAFTVITEWLRITVARNP